MDVLSLTYWSIAGGKGKRGKEKKEERKRVRDVNGLGSSILRMKSS